MISTRSIFAYLTLLLCISGLSGCLATLDEISRQANDLVRANSESSPTQSEMAIAIRQALSQGINNAISFIGKTDGFNSNQLIRIAAPADLQKTEKILRKVGQGKYVDQFVLTLNRAAEKAVPNATSIFANAITKMSIQDALQIIQGPQDSATQYFRRSAEQELQSSFKPAVQQATSQVGATQAYKKMIGKAGIFGNYISADAKDIDGYITGKAVDALFIYIAEEEKKIRENPVARTTDILKRVFGYYAKN